MEIGGLPLHPLVVHAAVVLTPLAALAVIWFALRPSQRWLSRWPALALALASAGAVYVSQLSGKALVDSRPELEGLVETHQERAEVLVPLALALVALTLLGAWSLGGPSALASGRGAREPRVAALQTLLPAVLVLVSAAALVAVVLVGDSGARAVWG